ncbi:MAG: hypothetical protein LIP00_03700 [Parabacteroides sp.]|nr:hypothetical protein [Parabacteroides sp.]
MIVIEKASFDFDIRNELFARSLYGRWDDFCHTAFEKVTDDILSSYDTPDEVVTVELLELDLGTVKEEKFYEQFPQLLAEKLKKAFGKYTQLHDSAIKQKTASILHRSEAVAYYLLHGYHRWDVQQVKEAFPETLAHTLTDDPEELKQFLLHQGYIENVRRRLIMQLPDSLLEKLIMLTASGDPQFIVSYSRFLITSHSRLHRPSIFKNDYRNSVWMVIFTYLWHTGKGYADKKQLLRTTISELAAHYGMTADELLRLLTTGIRQVTQNQIEIPELIRLLTDIQVEYDTSRRTGKTVPIGNEKIRTSAVPLRQDGTTLYSIPPFLLPLLPKEEMLPTKETLSVWLKKTLRYAVSCRKFLQTLREKEIYAVARIAYPKESPLLISFARELEKEKERNRFEGRAGSEFRLLKWEFLFAVSSNPPAGTLDRYYLVESVLQRLAVHYALSYADLLYYFRAVEDVLPVWLRQTLTGLYLSRLETHLPALLHRKEKKDLFQEEREKLTALLSHPVTARRLISRLKEEEIRRLAHRLFPLHGSFICRYAAELDKADEQGMLEGKAGRDFRLVKWEFIFLISLSGTFNRKAFVLSVLRQLSAHYGIDVRHLIAFFHTQIQQAPQVFAEEIKVILSALWKETEEKKVPYDSAAGAHAGEAALLVTFLSFLRTGYIYPEHTDLYTGFIRLTKSMPEKLYREICRAGAENQPAFFIKKPRARQIYATVLRWFLIKKNPVGFTGYHQLLFLLDQAVAGKKTVSPYLLREWLRYAVQDRWELLDSTLQKSFLQTEIPHLFPTESASVFSLLRLMAYYRKPEIALFIKNHRKEIVRLFSSSGLQTNWKNRPELIREVLYRLLSAPGEGIHTIWNDEKLRQENILYILEEAPEAWQWMWIYRMGSVAVCKAADEIVRLTKQMPFHLRNGLLRIWLIRLTTRKYANLSLTECYFQLYKTLFRTLKTEQKIQLTELYRNFPQAYPGLEIVAERITASFSTYPTKTTDNKSRPAQTAGQESGTLEKEFPNSSRQKEQSEQRKQHVFTPYYLPEEEKRMPVYIENAGLVLLHPWFPQLFQLQHLLTDEKVFIDADARIKAIFLLQALIDDTPDREYEEQTLILNKLLTGCPVTEPLPRTREISEADRQMLHSLLDNVLRYWEKMKNTSPEGFRQTFLKHEGYLTEEDERWTLTVPRKGADMLLSTLPWGYSIIKYAWMEKMITVEWV